MTPTDKPGWQTTEFWITLATQVVAVLVLTGVIKPENQELALSIGTQIVTGLLAAVLAITYIVARFKVKTTAMTVNKLPALPTDVKITGDNTQVKVDGSKIS